LPLHKIRDGIWVLTKLGEEAVFTARQETQALLEEKETYFQKAFILPFKEYLRAQTYRSGNFSITDDHLDYDRYTVYYKGFLDRERLIEMKGLYPEHEAVLNRLYDNYRVIPCSSKFRFNLDLLMRVIVDKLESHAIGRFGKFKVGGTMNKLSFSKAKLFRNMVIFDEAEKRGTAPLTGERAQASLRGRPGVPLGTVASDAIALRGRPRRFGSTQGSGALLNWSNSETLQM
jgi:hypothetical protein